MKRPLVIGAAIAMILAASQAPNAQTTDARTAPPTRVAEGIVATVDGVPITHADVRAFHATLPPQYQQIALGTIFQQLVERLIDQKLAAAAARASGLASQPAVRKRLAMLQESYLNQIYIEKRLGEMVSESRLRRAYRKSIALQPKREEVRARHILLKTEAAALAVLAEIKGGADFADLAARKSTGPSARNGGDLGFFGPGQMVPAFSAAAFALKPGEVTQKPVKTQFGWHVIKLEERRLSGQEDYKQALAKLHQKMTEEAHEKLTAELRAKARIDIKIPGGGITPLR